MRLFVPSSLPRAALMAFALLAAPAALAQQPAPGSAPIQPAPPPGDPVVARVDGEPITLSEVTAMARTLPEELRGAPPQVVLPLLVDQMVTQRAIVGAARRAGLDRDPTIQARIRRAEDQELAQALIAREIAGRIDDAAIRRRYDRDVGSRPPEEEVHARHILVATEAEAREALREVQGGADFAAVATRRSTGPGAQQGGDLGFFKRGDLVPEFAAAAFALQPGQVSENPVRTPFGWHVIRVEERRTAPPQPFEEARDAIRQQLFEDEVNATVERIRGAARIERFNLDGTAERPTDRAEPPAPAAPPGRGGAVPSVPRR
ncbi:peptidylprolyl isomerase [Roseomonas hellenica]|uniref:Parvulin-like PPIase n=1 Tax=Plastoroseomonas hellenica TaxID=2687306 RepID=A0ABS5F2F1_9PROT|nr:peptidylprolyl isomerase [Plastoroseomonas hellenica]MBR0666300.1 peptidylprolyl isomerase [Plastoroseomonas hellenica]